MVEWWESRGREAYHALGRCVSEAIENDNSEIAVICGYPMLKLAETEGANYFGGFEAGAYNYNTAHELAKQTVELAEREGVPAFLRDEAEEMKKILKEGGW